MGEYVKVAKASEIGLGQGKLVEAGGNKIALFNVEGSFYAIDDTCSHKGGPLSDGVVEGSTVTCPWHGAKFEIKTGEKISAPAPASVTSYKVQVVDGEIEVEL